MNRDGTMVETIATGPVTVGIALDRDEGKLYWAEGGTIRRANLDGTNAEVAIADPGDVFHLALDDARQKIYWTAPALGTLIRADVDGGNRETIAAGSPAGVHYDPVDDLVYWSAGNKIFRANPDGSSPQLVVRGASANGIAVDPIGRKVYFRAGNGVMRANLDGTDAEPLFGLLGGSDVEIDAPNRRIYVARNHDVRRAELDGRNPVVVHDPNGANSFRGIALDGPSCGDGILDPGEDCEGCPGCHWVCGNGDAEPGEQCDDGNALGGDGCETDCTVTSQLVVDQSDAAGDDAVFDQKVEPIYGAYDSEVADDFIVTDPAGWDVSRLATYGHINPDSARIEDVTIRFYPDVGGLPGDIECDYSRITSFVEEEGDLSIILPRVCELAPGRWWVSQQVRMDLFTPTGGLHYWAGRSIQTNHPSVWRNPGSAFGTGCEDWTVTSSCFPGLDDPDLLYQLFARVEEPDPVPATGPLGTCVLALAVGITLQACIRRRR
jgi:cysteine-rich repeat protein